MKKPAAILLMAFVLICFAACDKGNKPDTENHNEIPETEVTAESATETDTVPETHNAPEIITVRKGITESYEWQEDDAAMKARCKTTFIILDDEEREKYPSLAKALDKTAPLCMDSHETDFESLIYQANRQLELYDGFNTQISILDTHIRRSDSNVFTALSDSYTNTIHIEDFRAFHGTSYDTQTGKELKITDVVKDMSVFAQIVENKLNAYMWSGEYYSETAVKDYFENRTAEGISWSLDYNGVTVYFNPGDIAGTAYGIVTATVSFEEHPEIFEEKYTEVPDAYIMKLPLACSSYLDINNDGHLEEFIATANYDEIMGMYSDLYLVTSDCFYEESICAYGFNPYYVKTADDRHLLYLFIEGSDSWDRLMNLYVYDITDGKVTKLDETALAPHHDVNSDGVDIFTLPTDPEKMYLDYFVEEEGFFYPSFAENYTVGSDGLPEFTGDGIMMDYPFEEDTGDESIV
ncbi:MAG: DUF3298 domain-containing protein, partial [Clostridia bacterium]|nr:DUF3298 domain-containing protein [Clostridia bacterium]